MNIFIASLKKNLFKVIQGNALRIYDVVMQTEYESIEVFYSLIVFCFILYTL